MSVPVELDDLRERVAEYGRVAFLVTVSDAGAPHVVSVRVELAGDRLVAAAGRTTSTNVAARPHVTILWPHPGGGDYCLIVDGAATLDDDGRASAVVVDPVRAVLHRVADASGDGPGCVTVLDLRRDHVR